ncbi:SOUL family heme-binding protein [Asticcacaulis sp. AC466]|uniref:SOUL family heme-binding protein n=1 Tax=Asticcacaulis sp. AC466 TaxID=1282362 RepID=UPI0012DCAD0A|nr:heme-binding protein [Asticcacaulis sp. AC466]
MAVEEPAFKLVTKDSDIEIRDYPALIAAEAHVSGDRQPAINEGFRLIADYIFGNNRQKSKVAMTAPVTQSASGGEKIAMTAPVTQAGDGKTWVVRFIMPSRYTMATLPQPNNARVSLVTIAPQRVAVIRFSGLAGETDITTRTQQLKAWLNARHLTTEGDVTLARYDPPWTLWFLRRNELLIPIAAK